MKQDLVDLHCHILPGIDDGAKNLATSLQLIRKEIADGVAGIMFTPHFHYERQDVETFAANRKNAFRQVAQAAREQDLRFAGKLGSEVFYTPALPTLDLKTLAFAGTRYLLMELPTTYHPSGIEETLYGIQRQGYTPILAHVERYPYVTEDPTLLYNWVSGGALAQINGAGLIRGGQTARLLQKYIGWGLVHLLCTDAHSVDHRPPNLRDAYNALPDGAGERFRKNAVRVFLGEDLVPPEPTEPRYRFGRWV